MMWPGHCCGSWPETVLLAVHMKRSAAVVKQFEMVYDMAVKAYALLQSCKLACTSLTSDTLLLDAAFCLI